MALTQVQGGMLAGSTNTTTTIQSNGTTAITIDSSQNVGIGTASPDGKLTIETVNSNTPRIRFQNASFDGDGAISTFVSSTGTDVILGSNAYINSAGNFARFDSAQAGSYFYANRTGNLLFGTNDTSGVATERMRIASDGNIAVGSTGTSGSRFTILQSNSLNTQYLVNSNATTVYGMQIYYSARTPNNTGEEFIYCGDTGQRFSARSNGGLANYSGNNVNLSDEREKTNIELAGNYLSKICSIPVKTFNYIDQNREEDDGLTLGVIAQDVQAVAPELVMESNWAGKDEPEKIRLGIYQTDLQYALMKAIQELNAKVTALEAQINK